MAIEYGLILRNIQDNRKKLDACPRHLFSSDVEIKLGEKVKCLNCGGVLGLTYAYQYILGFIAAGGNPDDIWPGYRDSC